MSSATNPSAATETGLAKDTTSGQIRDRLPADLETDGSLKVADVYTTSQYPADQTGDGTVKTFTFATAVDLVVIRSITVTARVRLDGVSPTSSTGVYVAVDEATYLPVRTTEVRVLASAGQISVWGFGG